MFTAALQHVLAWHMLPHLSAKALGQLACSCKAGREIVDQGSVDVWRAAGADVLPPGHPARSSSQVSTIRAALADYGACKANLSKGRVTCVTEVPRVLARPKFAPNGRDFAVLRTKSASLPVWKMALGFQ
ncbi:hypothetical protein WJX73_006013 [Symbiochloris irregularis]|uniref:Uncharacterized protein n=1 Tax=Symbiochloris irregularis TaxID=706552 RepID=A0AAW1NZW2_9CHLO